MTDACTTPPAGPSTARPSDSANTPTHGVHAARSTGAASVDPFRIRDGIVGDAALSGLRSRKKGVGTYQARQNNLISALLTPMEELTADALAEDAAVRLRANIVIYASLGCNFVLCILQLYAAISAVSLSLLATGLDSVFDLGSNVLLFWLHRKASRLDSKKWPVGGARLQTIGNVVYGAFDSMCWVNFIVVVESIQTLISKKDDRQFHLPSIIAVASALGVKFLLFLYSYSLRNKSSQVRMLWQDHRNDLFINGFGILMSCAGSKFRWYLDPAGAVIIGVGVSISWSRTIYKEFELLAGKAAPNEFMQLLIYKAATYTDVIDKVDTVRAYHSGPDFFVEVDIVMDAHTPLYKAHDVSERLQTKFEALPHVERAFVHVDYEWTHAPARHNIFY
ncbi:hypothetical protein HYPSUDRAFT_137286 [Hypholoma sublateritium FD-334 SS-4]|uniref:Uncharacterized protein n=1 Tax=Hypholoma sublateritium (strain FD-334 SS-4) TaxID=945553 RepID=A0A0D2NYA1_HYPSF|nr:hypothetical protein HYPSUDRAFT_137286 [Hypholoma sublateritium FD-334 SS-4]